MKEDVLRKLIESICDGYVDTLMTGIEEYEKNFPYTIACANFIYELKQKNILVDFNIIFDDSIVDMVLRETSNYLARQILYYEK